MLYKQEIYDLLKERGIRHEITEHKAVFNMEELEGVDLPYPDADAKNLFIRDDKHRNYYLITVKGDKRVDLKEFRKTHGTRPLTFVKPDELASIMGLIPGAVSPFGLLNDSENKVVFYIDSEFLKGSGLVGVHPNDNTATVWLKAEDLIRIIEEHGNEVHII
ncbi:MAG: prolyl-tRNA synthetase associated domain-containing protein [Firmicutes bacterium]|nr:prolyl-tRNA synthetase associated domain-containing protein [Bacillota bacterium]